MMTLCEASLHFARDPAVCGGALVIAGTRVLVELGLRWLQAGNIDGFWEAYPHLTEDQRMAVATYRQHGIEVAR